MKHILLSLFTLFSIASTAQQTISFEAEEGFTLGNIHNQNQWEVTTSSNGIIENQTISNAMASNGSYAFKNAHEPNYDPQWLPIFGASLTFIDHPISATEDFSISYDIWVTEQLGSDFEFTLYGITLNNEYYPIAGVGIENRGLVYVIKDENYGVDYTDASWEPNTWVTVKIELNQTEIKYYVDNTLIKTINRFNSIDILGFNMLHNNYGHNAYYDNIQLSSNVLEIEEIDIKQTLNVYPNPVKNVITIGYNPKEIEWVEVYNMMGAKLKEFRNLNKINLSHLPKGNYFLRIKQVDGEIFSKKILKK